MLNPSQLGPVRQNTALFIWKEPPAQTTPSSVPASTPPEPTSTVVQAQAGVKMRRKDPHKAARRHTLSHGLDATMVSHSKMSTKSIYY